MKKILAKLLLKDFSKEFPKDSSYALKESEGISNFFYQSCLFIWLDRFIKKNCGADFLVNNKKKLFKNQFKTILHSFGNFSLMEQNL